MNNSAENLDNYEFLQVIAINDLPTGERIVIESDNHPIVLFNISGNIYAIDDICTHDEGSLNEGELDGFQIVCPRHGARFDVRNGKVAALPAFQDIVSYPVRVVDGFIEIGIPKG